VVNCKLTILACRMRRVGFLELLSVDLTVEQLDDCIRSGYCIPTETAAHLFASAVQDYDDQNDVEYSKGCLLPGRSSPRERQSVSPQRYRRPTPLPELDFPFGTER